MNNKKTYWQWKSTIIDFDTISDEKADFGDYITKKEMIFHYLGIPDKEIHEWYNGGYSCEYNYALKYAKELGLVENYIDYDDELFEKQQQLDKYKNVIDKIKEYAGELRSFDNESVEFEISNNILELLEEVE